MARKVPPPHGALAALLALCALPLTAATTAPVSPGRHEVTFTSSWDASTQPYQLFIPKSAPPRDTRGRPLLVVLHGRGVDHHAWFNLTPILKHAESRGWLVTAPYARGNVFYRGPAERDVLDVVADVARAHKVDPARIHLAGHSMGGWGTFWIGLRNPQVFASMAPMSGWAPFDLLPNARMVPPFIVHDEHDPIVPVDNSRAAAAELARLGITHHYREESGYGHGSGLIGDNFDRMFAWFDAHPKPRHPARFAVASRAGSGLTGPVRFLSSPEPWRASLVDVDRTTTSVLRLNVDNVTRFALAPATGDTTAVLNGRDILLPAATGEWNLFELLDGLWNVTPLDRSDDAHEGTTVPLRWKDADPGTTAPVRIQQRVADVLRTATKADLCLMNSDWVVEPDAPLTMHKVLDIHVFRDERIAVLEVSGHELKAALEAMKGSPLRIPELFPTDVRVTSSTAYRVVMPAPMADDFDTSATPEILPRPIGAYLLDATEPDPGASASAGPRATPAGRVVYPRLMPLTHSRPRSTTATVDTVMLHFSSDLLESPGNPFDVARIIAIYQRYGVSAHYIIDRQGNVIQLVDEGREAFHAGRGTAPAGEPRTNRMNAHSIGIEMLAVGSVNDMKPYMDAAKYAEYRRFVPHNVGYTDLQYAALRDLIDDIRTRHPAVAFDRDHIIGHDEYAPGRKTDPGEMFDWRRIGLPKTVRRANRTATDSTTPAPHDPVGAATPSTRPDTHAMTQQTPQPVPPEISTIIRGARTGQTIMVTGYDMSALPELPYATTPSPGAPQYVFSDDPEYFRVPEAVGMRERVSPGVVRIYIYHVNGMENTTKKIATMIENIGDAPMKLRLLRFASTGPSVNYHTVAKGGLEQFFNSVPEAAPRTVAPGAMVAVDERMAAATVLFDELVHGWYEVEIDQPAEISTVMTDPDVPFDVAARRQPVQPPKHQGEGAGRGTFSPADYNVAVNEGRAIDTADGGVRLILADGTKDPWISGIDGSRGARAKLAGNYGVLYTIRMKLRSSDGRGFAVIMWNPRSHQMYCGGMASVVRISDGAMPGGVIVAPNDRDRIGHAPEAALVQRFDPVPAGTEREIEIVYSPPGASCLPIPIVFVPYEPED